MPSRPLRVTLRIVVYVSVDSPDSIGPILFHHKELAEHLRSDLHTKQHGKPSRRAGEQTLFTNTDVIQQWARR
jgi:hypothetical protein